MFTSTVMVMALMPMIELPKVFTSILSEFITNETELSRFTVSVNLLNLKRLFNQLNISMLKYCTKIGKISGPFNMSFKSFEEFLRSVQRYPY